MPCVRYQSPSCEQHPAHCHASTFCVTPASGACYKHPVSQSVLTLCSVTTFIKHLAHRVSCTLHVLSPHLPSPSRGRKGLILLGPHILGTYHSLPRTQVASWKGQDVYSPPTVSEAVPQSSGPLAAAETSGTPELLRRTWSLQSIAPAPTHKVKTYNYQGGTVPSMGQNFYFEYERVPWG